MNMLDDPSTGPALDTAPNSSAQERISFGLEGV